MNKFLVIGASSFTGKNFIQYLKDRRDPPIVEAGLRALQWLPQAKDNIVVNFAAVNVVAPSWEHHGKYFKVNVGRVMEMVDGLKTFTPKRYVHISTPEVYGSTSGLVREDHPYNPSTPYAVSRVAAELMLKCYWREYGFPVMFTRASNVYGPGQQLYRLIPKLIVSIRRGIRFPLEGGGNSRRAFVHVRDCCDGIYRVATEGQVGEAYNMSSPLSWSIYGVVEQVCKLMGVKVDDVTEIVPERPGKDQDYRLDDTKIRKLGWNDWTDLKTGIEDTILWSMIVTGKQ